MHLCDDKTLGYKIDNTMTDTFLDSFFKNNAQTNINLNIGDESETKNGSTCLKHIYMNYLLMRQFDMEYSLQKNQFMKSHSFNRIKLKDINLSETEKDELFSDVLADNSNSVKYLSKEDLLNLWRTLKYIMI